METILAYSYQRFSSVEQKRGDSLRRQSKLRDDFLGRNGLQLDESLTLIDAGVSGFKGRHRLNDRHHLSQFVALVKSGRIPKGSYLIVESLDRLSREEIVPALGLLLQLIEAGVRVVQLLPVEAVYDDRVEPMQLMMALMELSRGNSESKMKSERIGASWDSRRAKARESKVVISGSFPFWLRKVSGRFELVPERVAVVQRMFELAADGYGLKRLVAKLIAEKLEPFSRSGRWNYSHCFAVLSSRRVLGEYQPTKNRRDEGDPISGYYPVVVSEELFYRVQAGLAQRKKTKGGGPSKKINLFAGLLFEAESGDRMEYRLCKYKKKKRTYTAERFVSIPPEPTTARISFPLEPFEAGVLNCLSEINSREVEDPSNLVSSEVATLEAQLGELTRRLGQIEEQLVEGESVGVLKKAAVRLEQQQRELTKKLTEAKGRATATDGGIDGCKSLIAVLSEAPDPVTARLRLRSLIQRLIGRMDVLIVRGGERLLACVQIHFRRSAAIRSVFIRYRPQRRLRRCNRDAHSGWSTTKKELPVAGDLSVPKYRAVVRRVMESLVEKGNWQRAFEPELR